MHTITLGKYSFQIPGSWNELTSQQLLLLAKTFNSSTELEELKVKLLFYFSGIRVMQKPIVLVDNEPHCWLQYKKTRLIVSAHSLSFVSAPFLKFFREEKEGYIIDPLLTRQLIPSLRISRFATVYGPADGLSNITFNEFIHAETAYSDYLKYNDEKYLDKLIGILYRAPGGKNSGDVRKPFDDYLVDEYAKKVQHIDPAIKKAIRWYYEGSKVHIAGLFPNVFRKGSGGKQTDVFKSFLDIADELSGNNPAENERTLNTQLYTVLNSLNQRIEKTLKQHG